MTKEQRAEALMARGPIQNVRRIMELEDELDQANIVLGKVVSGECNAQVRDFREAMREAGLRV